MRAHPVFRREGNNLYIKQPVDLYTLLLGEVQVETFKGKLSLRIPAETPSGWSSGCRQQGMPVLRNPGQFGDLFVKVEPLLPQKLSDEEKRLFRQLRSA